MWGQYCTACSDGDTDNVLHEGQTLNILRYWSSGKTSFTLISKWHDSWGFDVLSGSSSKKYYVNWKVFTLSSSLLTSTTAVPSPPHDVNWVHSGARSSWPGVPAACSTLLERQPACSDLCKPQCVASLWCCCWLQRKRKIQKRKKELQGVESGNFLICNFINEAVICFPLGPLAFARTRLKPVVKWGNLTSLFCLSGKAARSG